jgi:hypothetical protein
MVKNSLGLEKIADYLFTEPEFDSGIFSKSLDKYGLDLAMYILDELEKGVEIYNFHFRRIVQDIFEYYDADPEATDRMDIIVARIEGGYEQRKPPDELIEGMERRAINRHIKSQNKEMKKKLDAILKKADDALRQDDTTA